LSRFRQGEVYSIAITHPENVGVQASVDCLKPTWAMVRGFKQRTLSEEEYVARYRRLICKRWPAVKRWLDELEADAYLCCWCTTGFCHRYLVAKLIRKFRPDLEVRLS
jgi:hypothetical protein